jgi:hypothetical protein
MTSKKLTDFIIFFFYKAYFRFDKVETKVHANDVIKLKTWVTNTEDMEKGLISYEAELLEDIFDGEDRYTIFAKADSADKEITRQIFAFKFNTCKFGEGAAMRENRLIRYIKKHAKYLNYLCPARKGLKIHIYNETYSDELIPSLPNEVQVRSHKEAFGKLKGMKNWMKLFTQDLFISVKK